MKRSLVMALAMAVLISPGVLSAQGAPGGRPSRPGFGRPGPGFAPDPAAMDQKLIDAGIDPTKIPFGGPPPQAE